MEILPESDKRPVVERRYRIDQLDPKKGIILTEVEVKPAATGKKPGGLSREATVAGVFAALGLAGLGVWLVRRGRGEWMK